MLRSPMGAVAAPNRAVECQLLRAGSVAGNSAAHRACGRILVVRRVDHWAARSRGGEFGMGTIGRTGGCQHVGNRAASTRGPVSPNDRRGCRLCRVHIFLRCADVPVTMACRPGKRTQILEHRRGYGRHLQTSDGVLPLGGLEERDPLDVALFHLRSVEQHLACPRITSFWAWQLMTSRAWPAPYASAGGRGLGAAGVTYGRGAPFRR